MALQVLLYYAGKEKLLTFGQWPEVSLAAARKKRDEARRLLADGVDPGLERQVERARREALAANTFEAVAREWAERHLSKKSDSYRERVISQLNRFAFPVIGNRPVAELTAPDILEVIRRVEKLNILETAHRVRQVVGQVIRYAVATGRAQIDPTPALRGALPPAPRKHMAAPDDPAKVGEILRALEAFQGKAVVSAALRLLPYVFVRPGELRTMRWADVDLEAAEWRFEASKTRTPHVVPLSRQALAILRDLKPLTGHLPGGVGVPERTNRTAPDVRHGDERRHAPPGD